MEVRVASDVGGTFTDMVLLTTHPDGEQTLRTMKTDTTPPHYEEAVVKLVDSFSEEERRSTLFFVHGSTIAINALLQRNGERTGLITTKGFRDVLEIARGNRAPMFDWSVSKEEPLVPRYLRKTLPGRISFQGKELEPLDTRKLPKILAEFQKEGVRAIAICLINSYANTTHEKRVKEEIEKFLEFEKFRELEKFREIQKLQEIERLSEIEKLPEIENFREIQKLQEIGKLQEIEKLWDIEVVTSHQLSRLWREYERTNTTVMSACVTPILKSYLTSLSLKISKAGIPVRPYIIQSNCGVDSVDKTWKAAIRTLESGPASGVLAAAELGRWLNEKNVISLDIGGTTAKCSLILDGQVKLNTDYYIEQDSRSVGYPATIPVVDIVEIGTGGGSKVWVDQYQKLRVGPQSAGAVPGPIAYGRGGDVPTTTDACLLLGYLNPDLVCGSDGGNGKRRMELIDDTFRNFGEKLGMTSIDVARAIQRIATNNMVNALKLVSTNRGYDPRNFTLIAHGGGGGLHTCSLALELGITRMIIPNNSSVFSAWGMLLSNLRRDYLRSTTIIFNESKAPSGDSLHSPRVTSDSALSGAVIELNEMLDGLLHQAMEEFAADGYSGKSVDINVVGQFRYRNQAHNLDIPLPSHRLTVDNLNVILKQFEEEYNRVFTYTINSPIELVGISVTASAQPVNRVRPVKKKITGKTLGDIRKEAVVSTQSTGRVWKYELLVMLEELSLTWFFLRPTQMVNKR
eukprot:TRINITY_DN13125_c0_g1_i2.p1 TRINITY_DN13125_c0_g1~~TRINITY_DN13125_c0_g1_i2.p1  ORF type:complete len:743 (-),score=174.52 TRINITY_DN13125_c0_g1_i2:1437-3665(-)